MNKEEFKTDVLINGAGPTGLMMACLLSVHKIPFRIIDKKVKRDEYSGAMIIHARSMEILHQIGLSIKFLKEGVIARKINVQFNYKSPFTFDIADFGNGYSLFPYIFILEQSKTEKLLRNFLEGHEHKVEDGTTLLSFSQKRGIVTSVLKTPDGNGEIVSSRFLIGAGGSTSIVRRQLKIPFYGITHSDLLFVSDSGADLPSLSAEMMFSFSEHHSLGFFPLPNNRWRIDGSIPHLGKSAEKISFENLDNYLDNNPNLNLQLSNSTWFSAFRSHSRYAPAFKHHHCFLVGDAAHIHSPVGAQGMNAGLHDAYNLAWKLAFYLKGRASARILDTYQHERLPVAIKIIRSTDKVYLWIANNDQLLKTMRLYLLPIVLKLFVFLMTRIKGIQKAVFMAISGVGISYRESRLSANFRRRGIFDSSPLPGDRLPNFQYFVGSRLFNLHEKIKYTAYTLLVFGVKEMPAAIHLIIEKYSDILVGEIISQGPGTEEAYKVMVRNQYACYLVRPDMHIAWRSDSLNARVLEIYLERFLIAANELHEA